MLSRIVLVLYLLLPVGGTTVDDLFGLSGARLHESWFFSVLRAMNLPGAKIFNHFQTL